MNRYRVFGHTTVTVSVEVNAGNEDEAYEKASEELFSLTSYAGNGGTHMLIGVDEDNQSVSADGEITYDHIELIGDAVDEDDEDEGDEE